MNVLARSFWLLERVPGRFEASVLLLRLPPPAAAREEQPLAAHVLWICLAYF